MNSQNTLILIFNFFKNEDIYIYSKEKRKIKNHYIPDKNFE